MFVFSLSSIEIIANKCPMPVLLFYDEGNKQPGLIQNELANRISIRR